jgi:hypothetical protein
MLVLYRLEKLALDIIAILTIKATASITILKSYTKN